jgi:hypothetical protein
MNVDKKGLVSRNLSVKTCNSTKRFLELDLLPIIGCIWGLSIEENASFLYRVWVGLSSAETNNYLTHSICTKPVSNRAEQLSLLIRPNNHTKKMRLFVTIILVCCFLGTIQAGSEPLQCHQGSFHLQKTGTEVTPCSSSKAKSCQIVYNRSKMSITQSCITTLCSVSLCYNNTIIENLA